MITCPDAGFFFMHIPKNGGSSVRDQIQPLDHFEGKFLGTKQHKELGFYDSSHVPLGMLKQYFPDAFSLVSSLEGYAILRDPVDRFASSIAQRFRQIHGRRVDQVTPADVIAEVDAVITHLRDRKDHLHHKFSHFIPQSSFVELDGAPIVRNRYRISDTRFLLRDLSSRLDAPLVEDFHSNKTVTFRYPWMAGPAIAAKDFVKARAPAGMVDSIRRVAMKALTTPRVQSIDTEIGKSDDIQSFIVEYYARDIELFAATGPRSDRIQDT
ncbi:sulfotransferase family protein [Octadecabacter sp. CECT 8868]|uniref:sulfotransferase family protein n=1 Tax=Octadecabacter algicola TaxID=2909342 RepID=UPI001F329276|nr:sulfotransferase family protein [Octadecabacter algicola]MCF2906680.1 sulfotransferase family protein [Octadecabacter algicola]